ncbi:MAG: hypothetical protein ABL961_11665 [Vicinamibacterales bacterium]
MSWFSSSLGRDDLTYQASPLAVSRFTIPVSVIVPATGAKDLEQTLSAALNLHYPEHEVIVVLDATRDAQFAALAASWELDAREFFYRRSLDTTSVRRIYRSARDSRLIVADKTAATSADAVNCGVNLARYRYVMVLPTGVAFDAEALLRLMAAPLRDPGTVLGASAHVEPSGHFARLRTLRSLMVSRLMEPSAASALPTADGVSVWRRDAVLDAGGFSSQAWDMDLDMAWRTASAASRGGHPGRFHRSGHLFGRGEMRVHRWQRPVEAVRQLLGASSSWRVIGAAALVQLAITEVMLPLAALALVAWMAFTIVIGGASWNLLAQILVAWALGLGAVSLAAVLVRGGMPGSPQGLQLLRLILSTSVELFVRPAHAVLDVRRTSHR